MKFNFTELTNIVAALEERYQALATEHLEETGVARLRTSQNLKAVERLLQRFRTEELG